MPQDRYTGRLLARLRAFGVRPSRKLGQSFLTDRRILSRIVEAAAIGPEDAVFEVGTGPATLTRLLAARARRVLSVEVDPELARFARAELSGFSNVEILVADILSGKRRLNPEVAGRLQDLGPFRWVSNLPFSVATPLILLILEGRFPLESAVVTVQWEVACKLTAKPGTSAYSATSVLLRYWADAALLFRIRPGSFVPPPKVESAVVRIDPRESLGPPDLYPAYRHWVERMFRSRRKQLGGLLRAELGDEGARRALELGGWAAETRPQELEPPAFVLLAREFPRVKD